MERGDKGLSVRVENPDDPVEKSIHHLVLRRGDVQNVKATVKREGRKNATEDLNKSAEPNWHH